MFAFGFSRDDSEPDAPTKSLQSSVHWIPSKEIHPKAVSIDEDSFSELRHGKHTFKHIKPGAAIEAMRSNKIGASCGILSAESGHSDLVPAEYEGGLKIWECTYDLIDYIDREELSLEGKDVLDLGCGAGILGILCKSKGAVCCFQDYNSEVIEAVTVPNVVSNFGSPESCTFYSGDWASFADVAKRKFDFIFTSETIYNTENHDKLHAVFKDLLKEDGTIYLAAKMYYFGVGGGIAQFEGLMEREGVFQFGRCWSCEEGVKRAILKIEFVK